jgi:hypothetical protein
MHNVENPGGGGSLSLGLPGLPEGHLGFHKFFGMRFGFCNHKKVIKSISIDNVTVVLKVGIMQ